MTLANIFLSLCVHIFTGPMAFQRRKFSETFIVEIAINLILKLDTLLYHFYDRKYSDLSIMALTSIEKKNKYKKATGKFLTCYCHEKVVSCVPVLHAPLPTHILTRAHTHDVRTHMHTHRCTTHRRGADSCRR